jgi:hypothetical protein
LGPRQNKITTPTGLCHVLNKSANEEWFVHSFFMPQSLSAVYIHLVFSTKDRRPLLRDKSTRTALHSYLGSVSKQIDRAPLIIGGVEDHVHLLARWAEPLLKPNG